MPVKGYLLIQCHMGKTKQVVKAIQNLKGIISVDAVTGSWDVIAVIGGESVKDLGDLVVSSVRNIEGVDKTMTCFVV